MSKLILYFNAASPPARAVLLLIRYLKLDVDMRNVDFGKREQFSEDFLKLNPSHEVPALVDGDFVLTESRAILSYLVNSRKPSSDLYPTDPKARARVDQKLCYDHVLFTRNGLVVRPIFAGIKIVPQQARDGVKEALERIDGFLTDSSWIAGRNLTIADFSAVTIVTTIDACGYDLKVHPNICRWLKQFKSLPGFDENLKGAQGIGEFLKSAVEGTVF